ncbi:hypothetical protein CTN07_10755 [Photobacterium damselae]|uniref:Uncharacterized protein n=1 Tax=Photobacterium damselae subsp. damselae CIP 102761 TaxID=675817 RepID=D0YZR0_PHODD|nr:hypothetical protein VDA_002773 [Photobacterium damselae subsp. damselae CIP 102761]PSW85318.1 hypothetical protein CTN07_10755 [Photobacterium damselae]
MLTLLRQDKLSSFTVSGAQKKASQKLQSCAILWGRSFMIQPYILKLLKDIKHKIGQVFSCSAILALLSSVGSMT